MNSRVCGCLCVVAALMLGAACKEDPTASLAGKAALFFFSANPVFLNQGDSTNVTVRMLDESQTPLQGSVQAVSTAPTVASVREADVLPDPTGTTSVFTVKALDAGPAYVRVTGAGLKDSARVNVLPLKFGGALSGTTLAGGSVLTINSTPVLKFNPATVSVTFGGGHVGAVASATADALNVLVPFSDPGPLTISGIVVTYIAGKEVTLSTASSITQTGDVFGTADESFATAPTLTLPTNAGESTVFLTNVGQPNDPQCAEIVFGFGSTGPCMIYKFDVPAPTPAPSNFTFSTNWEGAALAPDIDIYACSAPDPNSCFEEGGAGATGAKPQAFTFTFPAGTHYFVIEDFDNSTATKNIVTTITRNKNTPTLTTTPSAGGTVGVTLNDDATLAGGFSPTGEITFRLYDPDQADCTGTPRYEETVTVTGNGTYSTSPGLVTDKAGTWNWTASYTGDTNNEAVSTACSAEAVTVNP